MLIFCLAEMSSIVAFPGGAYGYVRCSVSPLAGFLVGVCEWLENNFYVMCCVWSNGKAITYATGISVYYEHLWFFITYVMTIAFHINGGVTFWMTMNFCAVCTILIILLYCFSAMSSRTEDFYSASFERTPENTFMGGAPAFIKAFHQPTWYYIGCETLMIAGSKITNVRIFWVTVLLSPDHDEIILST